MSESADVPRQLNVSNFLRVFQDSQIGAPYKLKKVNPDAAEKGLVSFERYFNPDLATDSKYFSDLNTFLKCVEKNVDRVQSDDEMNTVCAKEFKALRLRGFDNELMYHNVNRKHFADELSFKRHENPY